MTEKSRFDAALIFSHISYYCHKVDISRNSLIFPLHFNPLRKNTNLILKHDTSTLNLSVRDIWDIRNHLSTSSRSYRLNFLSHYSLPLNIYKKILLSFQRWFFAAVSQLLGQFLLMEKSGQSDLFDGVRG